LGAFPKKMKKSKLYRYSLITLGSISLVLGVIGIFLPGLPTTPFLLLTAALYYRSSDRFYNWLINHKVLGEYIRNFRENKAIPKRVKIWSIVLLWVTISTSAYFFIPYWWARLLMLGIAVGVTIHILSFKTLPAKNDLGACEKTEKENENDE
jgi:uncharacterized membrane protein YbaN (DUF454 family)